MQNNKNMDISVIIPTYKPGSYIYECLNSLVSQTFPHERFEILLILNGCKNPYKADLEKYIHDKMQTMNVSLIQTEIPGVSNARNIGLDKAIGEYICFIDDDDYVSATYLEKLFKKACPNTVSLSNVQAFCDVEDELSFLRTFDDNPIRKEYKEKVKNGKQFFWKARKYFSGPCMKMIHREVIGKRRYDVRYKNGEDSLFMFLISNRIKYIDFASEDALYYRRFREGSAAYIPQPFGSSVINACSLFIDYTKIYLCAPFSYNLIFYITRLLSSIHLIIWRIQNLRNLR